MWCWWQGWFVPDGNGDGRRWHGQAIKSLCSGEIGGERRHDQCRREKGEKKRAMRAGNEAGRYGSTCSQFRAFYCVDHEFAAWNLNFMEMRQWEYE